jgi:hypothetical protein
MISDGFNFLCLSNVSLLCMKLTLSCTDMRNVSLLKELVNDLKYVAFYISCFKHLSIMANI